MADKNEWLDIDDIFASQSECFLVKTKSKKVEGKHSVFKCFWQEDISHYAPNDIPCTVPREGFHKLDNGEFIPESEVIAVKELGYRE